MRLYFGIELNLGLPEGSIQKLCLKFRVRLEFGLSLGNAASRSWKDLIDVEARQF